MSKPLTIDELKALQVGDWVWVVDKLSNSQTYAQVERSKAIGDKGFIVPYLHRSYGFGYYDTYGEDWLVYKNKEQAEAKGEIVELPCKIGDPIWVVYRDFDHGFNEYKIYESICTGFSFEHGTEIRIVTALCCYDFDRVGNYTDKSEAEATLKELQKENK